MTAFHWQCGVKNTKPPLPPMPARSSILYYCFVCFCEYNCCFLCVVYISRKNMCDCRCRTSYCLLIYERREHCQVEKWKDLPQALGSLKQELGFHHST